MVDQVRLAEVAKRLVRQDGREILVRRLPQKSLDSDRPWRADSGEERIFPDSEQTVFGVAVPLGSGLGTVREFEMLEPRPEKVFIIEPTDCSLLDHQEICDEDGLVWRIMRWQELRPGSVTMLYFAAVMR